jgi:hypothetical protein
LRALGVFTNRPLLGAIAFELVFVAALCYLPPLQAVFRTAPLPFWVILLLIPCPVLVWGADELSRWIARRRSTVSASRGPGERSERVSTRHRGLGQ